MIDYKLLADAIQFYEKLGQFKGNQMSLLGSYANRDHYNYACGTGLALPRFTIANEVK